MERMASGMFGVHTVPDEVSCSLIVFKILLGFKEFVSTEAVTRNPMRNNLMNYGSEAM
jgi:hypothetical protein